METIKTFSCDNRPHYRHHVRSITNNNNNQNHLTRYEFNRKLINRSLNNIKAYSDQTDLLNISVRTPNNNSRDVQYTYR